MDLEKELGQSFQGEIKDDQATRQKYSRDASIFKVVPEVVAFPKHTDDIKSIVTYAAEHDGVTVTARSGGTCMSGGSLTESIVVNISKHMNNIISVRDHEATVQPGAFYRDFEKATLEKNLLLPPYPASRDIATVGGMVSNNSGGEKSLTYGKTEKFIKQLKVVLSDGNEYVLKPLNQQELDQKMAQPDFEGKLYRQTFELVDNHYEKIHAAKPDVTKNSAGYDLWNIWDKETFDITQLFSGAQGTLGIITEITFKLVTPNPESTMLVMFLKNTDQLGELINTTLTYKPESFESYDDHTLGIALKFFPQLMRQMGIKNVFALGRQLIPEIWNIIISGGMPKLVLLAEFTGHDIAETSQRAEAANAALKKFGIRTHITKSKQEAEKYWTIRRESFSLLRNKVKDKQTAPFIDDLTVRPEQLPEFLPRLNEILSHYDIEYTIAGHVGDANFHIIPLMDLTQKSQRDIIPVLSQKVYDLVFEFNGSMSGEHNDGLVRSPYLEQMYGKEIYAMFEKIKTIFDPKNIFNPGKKVGSSKEYAFNHIIKE